MGDRRWSYVGGMMPTGPLAFKSGAQTFNEMQIVMPPQLLAASNFLVDSLTVTAVANSASYAATSVAQAWGRPAWLISRSTRTTACRSRWRVQVEVAGQATAEIRVEYNGILSAPVTVPVTNTMPGYSPPAPAAATPARSRIPMEGPPTAPRW